VVKPRRHEGADDDGSAAPLYFDFEDEDGEAAESEEPEESADGTAGGDAGGVGVVERDPGSVWWWPSLPRKRQRTVIRAVVLTAAVALAVGGTVAQASQRAHDRIAMSAVAGNYVPSPDGEGLDLAVTLRDDGPAVATLIWVGVDQPGLALGYPPLPLPIKVGHEMAITLGGRYTCNGSIGRQARTLTVMVQSPRGVVSDITLPMPSGAVLPDGWQDDRAAFCSGMALVPQGPVT
jgi:hypothetical protein